MNSKIQTTVKSKEPIIPELKPSMARAPRANRKKDILKSGYARVGVHYEVYKPNA